MWYDERDKRRINRGGSMNLRFVGNDYMLAWTLLYQASISKSIQDMKTKLWQNYRTAYNNASKDDKELLSDYQNFIPDNDEIYDFLFESEDFQRIKKETEKYRLFQLKTYDDYKKELNQQLSDILRIELKSYDILTLHPNLDCIDTVPKQEKKNALAWGRHRDQENPISFLVDLSYVILRLEIGSYQKEARDIVDAVIELATLDELATRMRGTTCYLQGKSSLVELKRKLYPYWLMYLGADKEKMLSYMMRDKIAFDVDKYPVEKQLAKANLYEFIDFCVKHQEHMQRVQEYSMN